MQEGPSASGARILQPKFRGAKEPAKQDVRREPEQAGQPAPCASSTGARVLGSAGAQVLWCSGSRIPGPVPTALHH